MKLLTLNFLTCARKACKASVACFPLHPREAELEVVEVELNPQLLRNVLPRLEWGALRAVCGELGLPNLPESTPDMDALFAPAAPGPDPGSPGEEALQPTQLLKDLHNLLLETTIQSGKLVCGNCGHEYAIREGIANFLLPAHLV